MERFTGLLGPGSRHGSGVSVLQQSPRDPTPRDLLGPRPANRLRLSGPEDPLGRRLPSSQPSRQPLLSYSIAGSKFVFGDKLGAPNDQFGVIFAFQVLPIIIFIASLFAILYYLGVMQILVRAMAVVMQRVMGTSGAESTNVAASIFMGQTEAPLTIRPFLAGLTQSELFTIMASGMAHVSGAVMAAYVLIAHVEIRHLLTAVIMTAPATLDAGENADARSRRARHHGRRQRWKWKSPASISSTPPRAAPATACNWPSTSAPC